MWETARPLDALSPISFNGLSSRRARVRPQHPRGLRVSPLGRVLHRGVADSCRAGVRGAVGRIGRISGVTSGGTTLFVRDGALTMLALAADGSCVCFDPEAQQRPACAIHRALGHEALPSACAHFPRVAVTDDRATAVTLSHFCPTAAAMLFRDMQLSIVEAPPSFNSVREYEGLDALRRAAAAAPSRHAHGPREPSRLGAAHRARAR